MPLSCTARTCGAYPLAHAPYPQRIIETCDEEDHGDVGGVGLMKDDGGVRRHHDGGDDHVHQRRRPPCARRSVIGAPSRIALVHRADAGAYQN